MEKVRNFLISFISLAAFFSLSIGGFFVLVLFFAIALYAGFEIIDAIKNKRNLQMKS